MAANNKNTKKWINKKTAQNFALVHRSHDDAMFYDEEASERVFVPISKDNKKKHHKVRQETKDELTKDLVEDIKKGAIRKNEGEAALFGITYDDSQYDYMQHLKNIGEGQGVFIAKEEKPTKNKNKEVAIKDEKPLLPSDALPSEETVKYDYQRQQDVPDEIKGFKPNLNPDLREVLEALEDEAYLDEDYDVDEGDVFGELLGHGKQKELRLDEYDENDYVDDDEWDMDNYDDEYAEYDSGNEGRENPDWEKDFSKFKKAQARGKINNDWDTDDEFDSEAEADEEEDDDFGELPDINNANLKSSNNKKAKKKARRKKGAMTDTSSYSMSSSALCRTEQMTIIDDKFDVMKEKYEEEEEDDYEPFDITKERSDFGGMIDDFLDNYQLEKGGRRIVKKNTEAQKIMKAADSASKSKLAAKRKKGGAPALKGVIREVSKMTI
ncbi:unnamed protein product [Ambrosiozyma monospora]|uniref:Unnamed protein product n=1 Tax=Ambrosiozyma monospora TaxID=43982 RepID=A0ACB5SRR3_AMBMO|nr:unnamed protein product [Ambrosiozyma monospora]